MITAKEQFIAFLVVCVVMIGIAWGLENLPPFQQPRLEPQQWILIDPDGREWKAERVK